MILLGLHHLNKILHNCHVTILATLAQCLVISSTDVSGSQAKALTQILHNSQVAIGSRKDQCSVIVH